jgi:hypothetical protein
MYVQDDDDVGDNVLRMRLIAVLEAQEWMKREEVTETTLSLSSRNVLQQRETARFELIQEKQNSQRTRCVGGFCPSCNAGFPPMTSYRNRISSS